MKSNTVFKKNLGQCEVDKMESEKNVNKLFQTLQRKAEQDGVGMALTMSAVMKQGS